MQRETSSRNRVVRAAAFATGALLLSLSMVERSSAATSNASVYLAEGVPGGAIASDFQNNTSAVATATLLGVTGTAQSDLGKGSVGAGLFLPPGSPFGFYSASADWYDTWSGGGSGSVPVSAAITLHGSIDSSLLVFSDPFWEISFRYDIGNQTVLSFSAFGDSTVPSFSATVNGIDASSSIVLAPNSGNPLLTDFSLTATPTVSVSGSGFSEFMEVQVRSDAGGPLTLDAFHTLQVVLTPLDPGVAFTGESGRTVGTVPEPGALGLMLGGLGLLAGGRRRGRS